MKKIIIIGIIILVVLLAATLIIFFINKQTGNSKQGVDQTPVQVSTPALPGTETAKISAQNQNESVRENILKAETSNQPTLDTKFQDAKNQPLTLEQFKAATKITIKPEIYDNLSQTDWSVFTCTKQAQGAEGKGLIMRFKPGNDSAYYANLYKKMNENLTGWESTIFSDLSPLFFSEKKFSQKPSFKVTKYITENEAKAVDVRYANVKSDDGANLSIDYAVYAEDVYIFNNPQCLRKALDKYQPALEP